MIFFKCNSADSKMKKWHKINHSYKGSIKALFQQVSILYLDPFLSKFNLFQARLKVYYMCWLGIESSACHVLLFHIHSPRVGFGAVSSTCHIQFLLSHIKTQIEIYLSPTPLLFLIFQSISRRPPFPFRCKLTHCSSCLRLFLVGAADGGWEPFPHPKM